MFVSRILRNEASCVVTLESHRSELFELIKECDDFPYGLQCELKRRVHTRNGDSVATKLACDIHTLMAVLEGGEFCELKDLISSGKGQRSQSQSQSGVCNMTLNPCDCASEIKALTENMNNLKASLLNVQQTQLATETTRSSQIQNLKSTVLGLKNDITLLSATVSKAVTDIRLACERIESEKSLGVVSLKTELRLVKDNVHDIQDVLENMSRVSPPDRLSAALKGHKISKKGKASKNKRSFSEDDTRCDTQINKRSIESDLGEASCNNSQTASGSSGSQAVEHNASISSHYDKDDLRAASGTPTGCADVLSLSPAESSHKSIGENAETGSINGVADATGIHYDVVVDSVGARNNPSDVSQSEQTTANVQPFANAHAIGSVRSSRHVVQTNFPTEAQTVSYSEIVASTSVPRSQNVSVGINNSTRNTSNIPVRTTNLAQRELGQFVIQNDDFGNSDDDDDFVKFVKKRAKRYYLGGFLPTITRHRIEQYVNRRGPTVTWIRMWKSKRNSRNMVIRLNVEDNEYASYVEESTFWPPGVTCRPWVDRSERSRGMGGYSREWAPGYNDHQIDRNLYGRADIDEYNPYSPLRDESNIY